MKAAAQPLIWLALAATSTLVAADNPSVSATPRPRPRLDPVTLAAKPATPERVPSTIRESPANSPVIQLEKYRVKESPLPAAPRPVAPEPKSFSLLDGGPLHRGKLGSLPFEAGLWASQDFDPKGWHSAAQATRVQFDFLRIKF